MIGSSPRGRGTPPIPPGESGVDRFIPARAGNTVAGGLGTEPWAVHPRAGGEHAPTGVAAGGYYGSSPRGRGTRPGVCAVAEAHRFIPARAGNTAACRGRRREASVHPRAGGEHAQAGMFIRSRFGSSPRGRGTRSDRGGGRRLLRFIPARAGNTVAGHIGNGEEPVHPRAGGEHTDAVVAQVRAAGSSPRGRGTPAWAGWPDEWSRFIPARAGNTSEAPPPPGDRPVHPRAGGEHVESTIRRMLPYGSSPRGRGTREDDVVVRHRARFIPARAGNTARRALRSSRRAVHPRAGGEHARVPALPEQVDGSSPRGRGTPVLSTWPPLSYRFIPARAGNTPSRPAGARQRPVHPRAGGEHSAAAPERRRQIGSSPRGRGTRARPR